MDEQGTFTNDFSVKTSIYNRFFIAMLNSQMVPMPYALRRLD